MIEGRIGTSKRKYGLDRIMTKIVAISRSVIGMVMFVANAEKILSCRAYCLLCLCHSIWQFSFKSILAGAKGL